MEPRKPFSLRKPSDAVTPEEDQQQMREERLAQYEGSRLDGYGYRMSEDVAYYNGERVVTAAEQEDELRALHGGLPDAVDMGAPTGIPAKLTR